MTGNPVSGSRGRHLFARAVAGGVIGVGDGCAVVVYHLDQAV